MRRALRIGLLGALVGGALAWLFGPNPSAGARVLLFAAPASGEGKNGPVLLVRPPAARGVDDIAADDAGRAVGAPVPAAEPWIPRPAGDPERRGSAGDQVLQGWHWLHEAPIRQRAIDERESRLSDEMHQEYVEALRQDASIRVGLDAPPWREATFRVAGTLGRTSGPDLLIVGRDFLPDASAEASLEWYEVTYGRRLVGATREEALGLLAAFAAHKRELEDEVADVLASKVGGQRAAGVAFLLTARQLVVVPRGASHEVDGALALLDAADVSLRVAVEELLR